KQKMIAGESEAHARLFRESGSEVLMGDAEFTEPKTVRVTSGSGEKRLLRGDRVFLAVGTRASLPAVPGLAESQPLTHVEALELDRLPDHIVVLGGGYVGLEFAQAMRRFGSRVTIVQGAPRLLEREDPEFSDALTDVMQGEGIEVL